MKLRKTFNKYHIIMDEYEFIDFIRFIGSIRFKSVREGYRRDWGKEPNIYIDKKAILDFYDKLLEGAKLSKIEDRFTI